MDYKNTYIDFLRKHIDVKKPLTVVLDASNGPTGMIVKDLWKGTPVHTIVINDDIDPDFKAHDPNPLKEGASDGCARMIKEHNADIGIMFDADGDRAVFIDNKGEITPSCFVAALIFKEIRPPYAVDELVYQSLRMLNVVPEKDILPARIGAQFLKERMRNEGATVGIEYSGHYCFKDFFDVDSGIFAAITVLNSLSKMNQSFSEWKQQFAGHKMFSKEIKIAGKDMPKLYVSIEEKYKRAVDHIDKRDGLTLVFTDYWINIRSSNTEPIMRIIGGGGGDLQKRAEEIEKMVV